MPLGWEMMGVSNKTDAFSFLLLVYLGLQGWLLLMELWLQQLPITQPARASICHFCVTMLQSAAKADLAEAARPPRLSRQRKSYALRVGAVLAKFLHAEFQPPILTSAAFRF
jgi:hypothetical protein